MHTRRVTRWLLRTAAGCSMLVATTAHAQDRALITWSGRVDKEAQITIRDTTVSTSTVGGAPVVVTYFAVKDRMPSRDGFVRVALDYGRGDVDVIQQPSAKNDYAAIIRIRDHSAGKDNYQLRAFWNPKNGEDRYSTAAASARANGAVVPANTMHWTGTVDREMKVEWRGYNVRSRNQSGGAARAVHSSVSNGLPDSNALVELLVHEGRGDVSIIQQPSSSNGYTAIFKVSDPQSGYGHYDFDVTWR
jgi:hypothetical protein